MKCHESRYVSYFLVCKILGGFLLDIELVIIRNCLSIIQELQMTLIQASCNSNSCTFALYEEWSSCAVILASLT